MIKNKILNVNLNKKPEKKKYYAAIIRVNTIDDFSEIYQDTVKRCFTLIQEHDGDINQFFGGVILALWGVPLSFQTDLEKCISFFDKLQKSDLPVSSILINDTGLYGSFGNDTRLTITAVSDKITAALKEIISTDKKIFFNKIEEIDKTPERE